MRVLLLTACLVVGCRQLPSRLEVSSWAIQLQGLESPEAMDRLVDSSYEAVVIDLTRTVRGQEDFRTKEVVARLKERGKLCLAYLNLGQAEDYRTYWRNHWKVGRPGYILGADPEGWRGNHPVAYWDFRWRAVLWDQVKMATDDGFDGLYLDWILGYEHPDVVRAAQRAGVDPARAMIRLLSDLRLRARPSFLLVAQNGAELDRLADVVDGFCQECLSFRGEAGAGWDDPRAGDIATEEALDATLRALRARGLPVWTLDYALDPENARRARQRSRALGCVPFVTRVPLDRLP